MLFYKYHALGNDYLVLDAKEHPNPPSTSFIQQACDRHKGLGSDGILYGPTFVDDNATFGLRIFNPDGTEVEKSGNGLRIFTRYLHDRHYILGQYCDIQIQNNTFLCQLLEEDQLIEVNMGPIETAVQPVLLSHDLIDLLQHHIPYQTKFEAYKVSSGNPHCVVPVLNCSPELAKAVGPKFEKHPDFPNRTNVQFMQILDTRMIKIEIWERGAGYTLSSGSSSCAAAAVARHLALCISCINVISPGGTLQVKWNASDDLMLQGPATPIGKMELFTTPSLHLLSSTT